MSGEGLVDPAFGVPTAHEDDAAQVFVQGEGDPHADESESEVENRSDHVSIIYGKSAGAILAGGLCLRARRVAFLWGGARIGAKRK